MTDRMLRNAGLASITALALALVACQRPEPRIVVQRVEVPVAVPCPVAPPRRPLVLPVPRAGATDDEKARALKASFLLLLGRYLEAETVLDSYRQGPTK